MKKLVSILMASLCAVSLMAGCSSSDGASSSSSSAASSSAATSEGATSETAEGTKEFKLGFDAEYPPYGYMDENGEYTGFDLELAQAVCDTYGWTFVPVPINWDSKDMELNSGSIYCIWNGFTIEGREDDYTWSEPYVNNSQVILCSEDSGINTLADLAGKTVGVQAASSALDALQGDQADLAATFGALQEFGDYNSAFIELQAGSIDAVAMDIGVANYQVESRGEGYKVLDETISTERYGIAFKKGNEELRDQVQEAITQLTEDGTVDELAEKYGISDLVCLGE